MNRTNNNNILVPTDFSEVANNALGHALKIADVYDNEITLINIQDEGGIFGMFGSHDKMELVKEAVNTRMDKVIEEAKVKYPKVKINKRIEIGKIYKVITEIAENENFDSIMMGTNGASGLQQIIGSNASRVINYAKVPVVVVKEQPIGQGGYEKIVLPIDLSRESRQKVKWAIHLAKKFNSTIHVIYENSTSEEFKNRIFAAVNQTQDILEQNNANYIVRGLDQDKYPDSFAEDTLEYSKEIEADLIIIMSQQEKGFSEFLLGSFAQQIVNHSGKVPVMCINSAETGVIIDGVFS
ncbi:MAG: universal stress protein [Bacteroidia bacterium]|nr:universal stress protein [Bacteroidia bacterium]